MVERKKLVFMDRFMPVMGWLLSESLDAPLWLDVTRLPDRRQLVHASAGHCCCGFVNDGSRSGSFCRSRGTHAAAHSESGSTADGFSLADKVCLVRAG